ncbi:helix-turn-helix domain-containing protein [Nocardioides dubius]|uniref:Fatty acid biosynthesis transcriptional regulator FasR n=1 Tax=Nocardioides dubius TaxID=317019 RepID=A0ABN1TMT0_9ACTN
MFEPNDPARHEASAILLRAVGPLSAATMARIEADKDWFDALSAEDRSWVGMVAQAGIRAFIAWYQRHDDTAEVSAEEDAGIATEVFGAAPRDLAGVVNLQQTVELIRLTIDVVERSLDDLLGPERAAPVHAGVLRYSRELAFATADVYARAAEARGAWDARLEALVVDSVFRAEPDETLLSRASALGWRSSDAVTVVLGGAGDGPQVDAFDRIRRLARDRDRATDVLCAVQGDRMVVVLGGVQDAGQVAAAISGQFAPGPVVVGPLAPDLTRAHLSARAAIAGYRVAGAWPDAPRPVAADELLAERALSGDALARARLIEEVFDTLVSSRGALIETVDAFFAHGSSMEATGRSLFVHPNTVRYRLRQVADLTGLSPTQPRHAYTLAIALTLGRLQAGSTWHELQSDGAGQETDQ